MVTRNVSGPHLTVLLAHEIRSLQVRSFYDWLAHSSGLWLKSGDVVVKMAWFCAYRCLLFVNWHFAFISLVAGMSLVSLVSSRELQPFPCISYLLHSFLVREKLPNPGDPTDHPIIRRERHRFSWRSVKGKSSKALPG